MSPAPAQPDTTYEPDPRRWKALTVCLVAGFMTLLDVSIVNVALPSIGSGLGAGESALQWVVSGYALAFGLVLVPAGRLGDAYGRRQAFLVGLVLFVLASVACGLAPGPGWLVAARLVQGAAGGVVVPQVSALIQQLFRGAERGRAFGLLGATIGLSTAVGPLLGGLLITLVGADHGWRAVFFVNLPIGVGAFVLALRLVPRQERAGTRQDLDPVGVLLLGGALTCLLLPLIQERTLGTPAKTGLVALALALLGAWVLWERRYGREHEPVVDLSLFRSRAYGLGAGIGLVYFAGFTGVFFIYTQFLQGGLDRSALVAGLAVTPYALGSAVAAALGGRLVERYGRALVVLGLGLTVLGFVATWLAVEAVPGDGVAWATALPLLVAGVGSGFVITPNITLALSDVPVARGGSAGGVLQTAQRVGAAGGIAATGSVFYAGIADGGDQAVAFQHGLLVITGFVVLALALGLVDLTRGRTA